MKFYKYECHSCGKEYITPREDLHEVDCYRCGASAVRKAWYQSSMRTSMKEDTDGKQI